MRLKCPSSTRLRGESVRAGRGIREKSLPKIFVRVSRLITKAKMLDMSSNPQRAMKCCATAQGLTTVTDMAKSRFQEQTRLMEEIGAGLLPLLRMHTLEFQVANQVRLWLFIRCDSNTGKADCQRNSNQRGLYARRTSLPRLRQRPGGSGQSDEPRFRQEILYPLHRFGQPYLKFNLSEDRIQVGGRFNRLSLRVPRSALITCKDSVVAKRSSAWEFVRSLLRERLPKPRSGISTPLRSTSGMPREGLRVLHSRSS
jgi:hypothetical protein